MTNVSTLPLPQVGSIDGRNDVAGGRSVLSLCISRPASVYIHTLIYIYIKLYITRTRGVRLNNSGYPVTWAEVN